MPQRDGRVPMGAWRGLLLAAALALPGYAQAADAVAQPSATIAVPVAVKPAADQGPEIDQEFGGGKIARNVVEPTLSVYLPDPARASGAGVIVAPGGAFMMLSMDHEGHDVARWLAAHGIAAFVLKYRTVHTYGNTLLFAGQVTKKVYALQHRDSDDMPELDGEAAALADATEAMRIVRGRAASFGIDPARIGFLGFSAGGITAIRLATEAPAAERPDFVGVIYANKKLAQPVARDAPPLFAAICKDDPFFPKGADTLLAAWRAAGVPAELKVYDKGGHGFGIKPQKLPSDHWIDAYADWLQARGLIKADAR
ncbi:MAG: alpha/beta hydrolase [Solimonas sp.]